MYVGDLTDPIFTYHIITDFAPEAVVHYAEQRAAPYSMIDRRTQCTPRPTTWWGT